MIFSVSSYAGNLLINPGFESGDKSDWIDNQNSSRVGNVSILGSHAGNYALQLAGDSTYWPGVWQKAAVIGGNTYEFRAWLKIENITTGGYMIQARWYREDGSEIVGTRNWIGGRNINTEYLGFIKENVAPEEANSVKLFLQANKADGVGYFDDLSIIDITAENLLSNPGFESGDNTSWQEKGSWDGTGAVVAVSPNSGDYSFQITGNPDRYPGLFQKFPATEGRTYKLSGSLKVDNILMGSYLIHVRWYREDGSEIKGSRHYLVGKNSNIDYKNFRKDVVAPAETVAAELYLQANKADGVGYFDDLAVIDVTPMGFTISEFTENKNAAPEAKVHVGYSEDQGPPSGASQDPYGTYHPAFPSINDNGDVSGKASYQYINPYSGSLITQWEASVWVNGEIHRFGVYNCVSSSCQSRALKLNNARTALVGSSHIGSGSAGTPYFEHAIKWSDVDGLWVTQSVDFDGGYQSYARDINDEGNVVGSALVTEDYIRHAQVVINGSRQSIGSLGVKSLGTAINNKNEITGSIVIDNAERAFWWGPGESLENPTLIPTLGGIANIGYDINDSAVIVGSSRNSENNHHAFKAKGEDVYDLGTLGGRNSLARSVNNSGAIVGYSDTLESGKHGFVFTGDVMYDLNDYVSFEPGWVVVDAYTINENGQILVRVQKNGSSASENNAYWVLSPHGFTPLGGPEMTVGNGKCQWGKVDCDIVYPPAPATNMVYQMPAGELPIIPEADIPEADAYVCNTGCENYSAFAPIYSTINEAIDNTGNYGTIVAMPGIYRESVRLYHKTLKGLNREYTVIDASGNSYRPLQLAGRGEIYNFVLTGGTELNGGGVKINSGFNVIENCIIQGNSAVSYGDGNGGDGGGIHSAPYSSFTMTNSIISQNKADYGAGYIGWSYSSAVITNNKFVKNEATGNGGGVLFANYATLKFDGNTLDSNIASQGSGIYVGAYTNDRHIRNSIITNHDGDAAAVAGGRLIGSVVYGNRRAVFSASALNSIVWGNEYNSVSSASNSIVEGGVSRYCTYCFNVITEDPMFVDPENGDFRLLAGSPAIDSGVDTSEMFTIWETNDYNGTQRGIDGDGLGVSVGNDYDMGAFEFSPEL